MLAPSLAKMLGVTILNKKSTEFFIGIIRQTMKKRRFVELQTFFFTNHLNYQRDWSSQK